METESLAQPWRTARLALRRGGAEEAVAHRHPNYVGVFLALFILTAVEVGITYLAILQWPLLLALSLAKGSLVVMYYMHLKFDLRVYRALFVAPFVAGVATLITFVALMNPHLWRG